MCSILIIQSNIFFRKSLKEALQVYIPALHIQVAKDEREAWEKIRMHPPDIVLIDLRLGRKSGIQLADEIKRLYPGVCIGLFIDHDLPEYRTAANRSGIDSLLPKDSLTVGKIAGLIHSLFPSRVA